jgi:epoxyqueuosine reductase
MTIRVSRHISQEVCPWNVKFSRDVTESALAPRPEIAEVTLEEWAAMDEVEWKRRTQGTAIRRAKLEGFRRNVLLARMSP